MSLADLFTRLVSPVPPHDPEPRPDEPFAPVYDHRPLGPDDYPARSGRVPPGRDPDPVVFGPAGSGDLQRH